MRNRKILFELTIVSAVLLIGTAIFRLTNLDLTIQRLFYRQGVGWYLKDYPLFRFLYHYGNIPAIIIVVTSITLLLISKSRKKLSLYRKFNVYIVIVMLIGPGLIVNAIFKDHWGRPRPRDVVEFGGKMEYLPVWEKGISGSAESFPCGHASMGFYLIVFFFILRRQSAKLAVAMLLISMLYGAAIGVSRVAQGGHFPSDVFWTAGFLYLTCFAVYYLMKIDVDPYWSKESAFLVSLPARIILISSIPISIYFLLLATPYHKERVITLGNPNRLTFHIEQGDMEIVESDSLYLYNVVHGFGVPSSKMIYNVNQVESDGKLHTTVTVEKAGVFTELKNDLVLYLPEEHDLSIEIKIDKGIFYYPNEQVKATVLSDSIYTMSNTLDDLFIQKGVFIQAPEYQIKRNN